MTQTPEQSGVEPRNEAVAVRVTASEKRAVQLLALLRDKSESEIMRTLTMEEIVASPAAERSARDTAA